MYDAGILIKLSSQSAQIMGGMGAISVKFPGKPCLRIEAIVHVATTL